MRALNEETVASRGTKMALTTNFQVLSVAKCSHGLEPYKESRKES